MTITDVVVRGSGHPPDDGRRPHAFQDDVEPNPIELWEGFCWYSFDKATATYSRSCA